MAARGKEVKGAGWVAVVIAICFLLFVSVAGFLFLGVRSTQMSHPAEPRMSETDAERTFRSRTRMNREAQGIQDISEDSDLLATLNGREDVGFDVAPNRGAALAELALWVQGRILDYEAQHALDLQTGRLNCTLHSARGSDDSVGARKSSRLAERGRLAGIFVRELQRNGVKVSSSASSTRWSVDLGVYDESALGPYVKVRTSFGAEHVLFTEMPAGFEEGVADPGNIHLRVRTTRFDEEYESIVDAKDLLLERIKRTVHEVAKVGDRGFQMGRADFRERLRGVATDESLLAVGRWHVRSRPVVGPDDITRYEAFISWVGSRRDIERIAGNITGYHRLEEKSPWIRTGLTLLMFVVTILGWLKVDWWLKGHHPFLTKLAFVMFLVVSLGLIWSTPITWIVNQL